MTIFNFYALENKASEERKDLFGEVSDAVNADKQPVSATPEDCLGSFFETNHSLELPVLITSGNGSGATTCWDKHKCDVLRHEGGVILKKSGAEEPQEEEYGVLACDRQAAQQLW